MIISMWAILGTIICIWFIATGRNFFNIPWCILICIGIYVFSPLILFCIVIYFTLKLLGFIGRK